MSIIEVKKLSKDYEYTKRTPGFVGTWRSLFWPEKVVVPAVRDVSFKIKKGELVGFLGPNGAGKTTTLKMLSGILYPSSGEASVLDCVPWQRKREFQKRFALVMGQKNQLWWDLPPMDSFILNKEIYEISDSDFQSSLDEMTSLFDIKDILQVPVRKLSLGQRMKCELVAVLLHRPQVIFLDEPTIGLDVVAQKNIRDFIRKYNKINKTTIILTSHYMEDIQELCERVIVIDQGQIRYDGKLSELIEKYAPHKELQIFLSSPVERGALEKFGQIKNTENDSVIFEIPRDGIKDAAAQILSSTLPVIDIAINEVSIDDVIRKMFND